METSFCSSTTALIQKIAKEQEDAKMVVEKVAEIERASASQRRAHSAGDSTSSLMSRPKYVKTVFVKFLAFLFRNVRAKDFLVTYWTFFQPYTDFLFDQKILKMIPKNHQSPSTCFINLSLKKKLENFFL